MGNTGDISKILQKAAADKASNYQYTSDAKYRVNIPDSGAKVERFDIDSYTKYLGDNFSSNIDRDDARARAQGTWAKLGNATMKMGGLALTTFSETFTDITVGTAEIVNRTINGVIDDNYSAAYSFAGFYDNPASRTYDQFNDYLEKAFPNYTTKKEQNSAWYENAFSATGAANFWGDKFLKNLGFTLGAIAGAYVTAGLGSAVLGTKALSTSGKLAKGLKIAKTADDLSKAATRAKNISRLNKPFKAITNVTDDLIKGGTKAARNRFLVQTNTSMAAAMTEAGIEGRNTANEYLKSRVANYIEQTGSNPTPELMKQFQNEAAGLGNTVLGLNLPILLVSNAVQFNKIFANNWSSDFKHMTGIKNIGKRIGLSAKGVMYEAGDAAAKLRPRTPGILSGTFGFKDKSWTTLAKNIAKRPATEGLWEEGMQGVVSRGVTKYYEDKYMNGKEGGFINAANSFLDSFAKTYGTAEGLEEVFIGAITGMVSFPTLSRNKQGKRTLSLQGGLAESIRDYKTINQNTTKAIEFLQNNKDYVDGMKSLFKNATMSLQQSEDWEEALKNGDKFRGIDSKFNDFISHVVTNLELGTYDIFIERLNALTNATEEEYREFFEIHPEDKIDSGKLNTIINKAKTEANRIKQIYEAVNSRFSDISKQEKDFLTSLAANADNYKNRREDVLNGLYKYNVPGVTKEKVLTYLKSIKSIDKETSSRDLDLIASIIPKLEQLKNTSKETKKDKDGKLVPTTKANNAKVKLEIFRNKLNKYGIDEGKLVNKINKDRITEGKVNSNINWNEVFNTDELITPESLLRSLYYHNDPSIPTESKILKHAELLVESDIKSKKDKEDKDTELEFNEADYADLLKEIDAKNENLRQSTFDILTSKSTENRTQLYSELLDLVRLDTAAIEFSDAFEYFVTGLEKGAGYASDAARRFQDSMEEAINKNREEVAKENEAQEKKRKDKQRKQLDLALNKKDPDYAKLREEYKDKEFQDTINNAENRAKDIKKSEFNKTKLAEIRTQLNNILHQFKANNNKPIAYEEPVKTSVLKINDAIEQIKKEGDYKAVEAAINEIKEQINSMFDTVVYKDAKVEPKVESEETTEEVIEENGEFMFPEDELMDMMNNPEGRGDRLISFFNKIEGNFSGANENLRKGLFGSTFTKDVLKSIYDTNTTVSSDYKNVLAIIYEMRFNEKLTDTKPLKYKEGVNSKPESKESNDATEDLENTGKDTTPKTIEEQVIEILSKSSNIVIDYTTKKEQTSKPRDLVEASYNNGFITGYDLNNKRLPDSERKKIDEIAGEDDNLRRKLLTEKVKELKLIQSYAIDRIESVRESTFKSDIESSESSESSESTNDITEQDSKEDSKEEVKEEVKEKEIDETTGNEIDTNVNESTDGTSVNAYIDSENANVLNDNINEGTELEIVIDASQNISEDPNSMDLEITHEGNHIGYIQPLEYLENESKLYSLILEDETFNNLIKGINKPTEFKQMIINIISKGSSKDKMALIEKLIPNKKDRDSVLNSITKYIANGNKSKTIPNYKKDAPNYLLEQFLQKLKYTKYANMTELKNSLLAWKSKIDNDLNYNKQIRLAIKEQLDRGIDPRTISIKSIVTKKTNGNIFQDDIHKTIKEAFPNRETNPKKYRLIHVTRPKGETNTIVPLDELPNDIDYNVSKFPVNTYWIISYDTPTGQPQAFRLFSRKIDNKDLGEIVNILNDLIDAVIKQDTNRLKDISDELSNYLTLNKRKDNKIVNKWKQFAMINSNFISFKNSKDKTSASVDLLELHDGTKVYKVQLVRHGITNFNLNITTSDGKTKLLDKDGKIIDFLNKDRTISGEKGTHGIRELGNILSNFYRNHPKTMSEKEATTTLRTPVAYNEDTNSNFLVYQNKETSPESINPSYRPMVMTITMADKKIDTPKVKPIDSIKEETEVKLKEEVKIEPKVESTVERDLSKLEDTQDEIDEFELEFEEDSNIEDKDEISDKEAQDKIDKCNNI